MNMRPMTALATLCLLGLASLAQAADKPTDPQIAKIVVDALDTPLNVSSLVIERM